MSRKVSKEKPDFQLKVRHALMPNADQRLARAIEILLTMCQQKASGGKGGKQVEGDNCDAKLSK